MSEMEFVSLAALMVIGFLAIGVLMVRILRRADHADLLDKVSGVAEALNAAFQKANVDMAARVEQVKGDIRIDLANRLQEGLAQVQELLNRRLAEGRNEQSRRLMEYSKAFQEGLGRFEEKTGQNLEIIRSKVDEKLALIGEQVQAKLEKNIQEGFAHFQKVQEHLKAAEEQLRNVGAVGQSINELNQLLKLPHLRGKFGEGELGRLLADFLPAGAFEEQAGIVPGSRELADAVVKFPHCKLPIDSKFNREAILPLFETSDPAQLEEARRQLSLSIKQQARTIAQKYVHPEHGTTDLALMFLPSETVYFEVLRNAELLEAIHKLKVFPVSPNTLVITLRAIAMSITQYEFAKNVEKTLEQIRAAQTNFAHFQKRFEDVGKGLDRAQEAYQTATGHLHRYANRVVQLTGEPISELPESSQAPNSQPVGPQVR